MEQKEAQVQQATSIGERTKVDLVTSREHLKARDDKNRLMTRSLFDLQAEHTKLLADHRLKTESMEHLQSELQETNGNLDISASQLHEVKTQLQQSIVLMQDL